MLLLGPYGGVVADRVDKRRLMIALQAMMGVLALALGVLTVTDVVRAVAGLRAGLLLGLNNGFENPARQSFVLEMVGAEHLRNAVSLNSVLVNAARAVGPAVGGLVIAGWRTGLCFLLNAVSFVAVVISLLLLDLAALHPSTPTAARAGQLREGLRYVRRTPKLAVPLLMMALVGCLAYEFQVVLPVLAREGAPRGAAGYGFMTAAMGVGAVVGGPVVAARGRTGAARADRSRRGFGVVILAAALAPNLPWSCSRSRWWGASVSFMSKGNSTLQLGAEPTMRGRVMSLWAVAFLGSTPIGGPIAGLVTAQAGSARGPRPRCDHLPGGGPMGLVVAARARAPTPACRACGWDARRTRTRRRR